MPTTPKSPTEPDAPRLSKPNIGDLILELSRRGHASYIMLAAAKLENALEELLCTRMPKLTKTKHEKLFRGLGPFSHFSTKIDVAHAMGDINDDTRHDLHVLRDLRNEFAHPTKEIHLHLSEVEDYLRRFKKYDAEMDRFAFLGEKVNQLWETINPRLETAAILEAIRREPSQTHGTSKKKSE